MKKLSTLTPWAALSLLLSANVMAEGKADQRSDAPVTQQGADEVVQHIHNKFGDTAAGPMMKEGDVHMDKGEDRAHGHSIHPHTVQGGKQPHMNMTAHEYKQWQFGSN
ncbi:hypothetical protein [Alkalimarinus coralli]|uniref:hypothetical protein n=1 Tax=Alkalimarinus coralli TaxID=2935863 RepID=UPI00202B89C7|nr:hypothetical protein [Alkalimarinus coralli]